jgi:alpha-tubulin suppressor-like RCC1 family protein
VCAITQEGNVKCWGSNFYGELGVPPITGQMSVTEPVQINDTDKYIDIAAGGLHTCGILESSNQLKCWGDNSFGELGTGAPSGPTATPTSVTDSDLYSVIANGDDFSCGITTTGIAKCWGSNQLGQLGNGTKGNISSTPTPVASGTGN